MAGKLPTMKQLQNMSGLDAIQTLDAMEREIKGYLDNPTVDPSTFPRVKAKLRRLQDRREEYKARRQT